jgi:hypothetical protein
MVTRAMARFGQADWGCVSNRGCVHTGVQNQTLLFRFADFAIFCYFYRKDGILCHGMSRFDTVLGGVQNQW